MAKSIIQDDTSRCYLCGMGTYFENLDCHHQHVYGGANRKLSEKYGLKVYLHHSRCHIFAKTAVHQNAAINNALKAKVQKIAMEHYGWDTAEFIKIFGKNYL